MKIAYHIFLIFLIAIPLEVTIGQESLFKMEQRQKRERTTLDNNEIKRKSDVNKRHADALNSHNTHYDARSKNLDKTYAEKKKPLKRNTHPKSR